MRLSAFLYLSVLFLFSCGSGGGGAATTSSSIPEADVTMSANDSSRFLSQATFGPNTYLIEKVAKSGYAAWIDDQIKSSPTYMYPAMTVNKEQEYSSHVKQWWKNVITSNDQLRQRMAFALSEIFVVSDAENFSDQQLALANYYDILIRHSFGNFRDLLTDVTINPIMGDYLSLRGNQKPIPEKNIRPDENYAREIMQLFTIGLVELNLDGTPTLDPLGKTIPTYSQDTIKAFAHIYTGWTYSNAEQWYKYVEKPDFITPMKAFEDYHDLSPQVLLNGGLLPSNLKAAEGLKIALDNIFNHPNVGPFISKQLIKKFVASNPSPEYVKRIATIFNNNGSGVRGDLAAVIKAILIDDEARTGQLKNPKSFGKLKEPLIRQASLWRAFGASAKTGEYDYTYPQSELQQCPLRALSVFNFFAPDFSQTGSIQEKGLVSPEFQIHDETSIVTITNKLHGSSFWYVKGRDNPEDYYILIDIDKEKELATTPDILLDHLSLLLLNGQMSTELRSAVKEMIEYHNVKNTERRVTEAIFLIMSSPEAAVLK